MSKKKRPGAKHGPPHGRPAGGEPTHARDAVARAANDAATAAEGLRHRAPHDAPARRQPTPTLPAARPQHASPKGPRGPSPRPNQGPRARPASSTNATPAPNAAKAASIADAPLKRPALPTLTSSHSPSIALRPPRTVVAPMPHGAPAGAGPSVIDIDAQTEREPPAAPSPPIPPAPPSSPAEVASRIRELEERLDKMIDEASRHHDSSRVPPAPPSSRALAADGEPTVFDTARELLSSDFYLRKWGRLGMRNRSEEVDDFGFDPVYERRVQPLFDFLYERYFRVECAGVENVPSAGRCLLVANHSGTLPYDGVMIKVAVKREHAAKRDVRWLAEDFIFHFPFLGSFSNRIGAVRACQENAECLLRKDALVAVFPEGVKGIGKLFKERYQLQRFGRGGFVKLCLRTGTPIVPVAVVGAEETNPMLGKIEYLSKALGIPYVPVTPTFPWLGPAGLLPAPTKWRIAFGEPITFEGYGPEAADDEILVGRLAERVRGTIQAMLDRSVSERRSVFFG